MIKRGRWSPEKDQTSISVWKEVSLFHIHPQLRVVIIETLHFKVSLFVISHHSSFFLSLRYTDIQKFWQIPSLKDQTKSYAISNKLWTVNEDKQLIDVVNGTHVETSAQMKARLKFSSVSIGNKNIDQCIDHWCM